MAVKTFGAAYFAARYFRAVWFAEADDSGLLPHEIKTGGNKRTPRLRGPVIPQHFQLQQRRRQAEEDALILAAI